MKILLMQPWISYRGAESVSVSLCYELSKLGHETKMLCAFVDKKRLPLNSRKIKYLMPGKFVSNLCYRSKYAMFVVGPIALLLLTLRNARRFDVLNPHNLPTVWIAVIAGWIYRKKVVWTAHGVPEEVEWDQKNSIFEYVIWKIGASRIDKYFVKKVDQIVSVSSKVAFSVRLRYSKDSVVIYSGVSKPGVVSKILTKDIMKLRKFNELLLIQVGTLHSQKRQAFSIKVVKKLNDLGIRTAIIFVGEGDELVNLKALSKKLSIEDKVYFAGFIKHTRLGSYYQICDLNIIPSIHESFSATPLEALFFGVVSVIPEDSGVLEVIKDFTIPVKPNPNAIFASIQSFKKNRSKFHKIATDGKKFVTSNMTWKNSTEKLENILVSTLYRQVNSDIYNKNYYGTHYTHPISRYLVTERKRRMGRSLDLLSASKGMKILDIGSGNGEIAIELAKTGCEVVGIDYSLEAVKLAEENLSKCPKEIQQRITFVHMGADKMNFRSSTFDGAICIDVFEHIYPESLTEVIKEIKRVMKPGARVVVETAPNKWFVHPVSSLAKLFMGTDRFESDDYHINVYNYPRFVTELRKIGKVEKVVIANDSKRYFSSRLGANSEVPKIVKSLALLYDVTLENPISSRIIFASPLKKLFGHEFWGVVRI